MALEDIDFDSWDLAEMPEDTTCGLTNLALRSIEDHGVHAWKTHLEVVKEGCNGELSVQYLSRIVQQAIEEVI